MEKQGRFDLPVNLFPKKIREDERWPLPRNPLKNNITCVCGYDSGLPRAGFLMVIPPEGLICPKCGRVILQGKNYTL